MIKFLGTVHYTSTAEMGQKLMDENYRSVNFRYKEDSAAPRFRFGHAKRRYEAVQVLKAIQCYEYQSRETPDWKETEAYAICQALRTNAIDRLPGYEDAKWAIYD